MGDALQKEPAAIFPDTPLFRQYQSLLSEVENSLLLFRLGDFYELFGEQAETVSRVLGLTLTTRDRNRPNPLPMCGIPARSLDLYLPRLVYEGFSVAIAEQVATQGDTEGLFPRQIVRVVTRATLIEDPSLSGGNMKNALAVAREGGRWSGACLDLTDGTLSVFEPENSPPSDLPPDPLVDWVSRKNPEEVLVEDPSLLSSFAHFQGASVKREQQEGWRDFLPVSFRMPELAPQSLKALSMLVGYVAWHQKSILPHLTGVVLENDSGNLVLDRSSLRHLDLFPFGEEKKKPGSLFEVLDRARTAMGSRTLRRWLLSPDATGGRIAVRHSVQRYFSDHPRFFDETIAQLRNVGDLERMLGRVGLKGRVPRDIAGIRDSLEWSMEIALRPEWQDFFPHSLSTALLSELSGLRDLLKEALVEEPAITLGEGPVISDTFDSELRRLRSMEQTGDQELLALENQEKERTGIENLRVRYNQVSGYFIEISKGQVKKVPAHYFRKQILTNVERFTIPELISFEDRIQQARQAVLLREGELLDSLRSRILEQAENLQILSRLVGEIDALHAFHLVGKTFGYCLPEITTEGSLQILGGRHPVLERRIPPASFVPNDVDVGQGEFIILTGPNMAGKSTYMRMIALIQIMAQAGAPVPADRARVPLVDRILTRVGASDHILEGESTFMVEMNEMSRILNEASSRSLVLLDEVGRGTSTFDGMALAWSISEFIHDRIRCRTLFATHYHELHQLATKRSRVRNLHVSVAVRDRKIIFHHRISPGHTSRSYGVDVARLAGIPEVVVERAFDILRFWDKQKLFRSIPEDEGWEPPEQDFRLPLFTWNRSSDQSSEPTDS